MKNESIPKFNWLELENLNFTLERTTVLLEAVRIASCYGPDKIVVRDLESALFQIVLNQEEIVSQINKLISNYLQASKLSKERK